MKLTLFLNIFKLLAITANSITETNFHILKNQDINTTIAQTLNNLISKVYRKAEMFCIASCNSNIECTSVVYDSKIGMIHNCFLYNRYFDSSELVRSSTSNFYPKKLIKSCPAGWADNTNNCYKLFTGNMDQNKIAAFCALQNSTSLKLLANDQLFNWLNTFIYSTQNGMQRYWLDSYSIIPPKYWTPGRFLFKKLI
jgi:hypothetical protein